MADQVFKYQEQVLADGSAVILNAADNPTKTINPGDPEWQAQAAVFYLTPKAA